MAEFPVEGDGSLNSIFISIPCATFPKAKGGIMVRSLIILAELCVFDSKTPLEVALEKMVKLNIRAAPVRNENVAPDSHWPEKVLACFDLTL
jgi:hypothetical protein